jgi:regulator of sirC expression with transglutaminase-like and TPR domain
MTENKEISALFHLIDDPDEEVFNTVSDKIISFGKKIIPNLETLSEQTEDAAMQQRIEQLIHRVRYRDLCEDFIEWKDGEANLLKGAFLIAKYIHPDIDFKTIQQEIEKIRRNIWLELNNYLTPLEKINVVTSILYNYYKQTGIEFGYTNTDEYLINKNIEHRKGNAVSNGILYLVLCELLDIPVKAINIPRQFILAYFDTQYDLLNPVGNASEKISFFVDPLNGQVYSHKDVEAYFKRIVVPPTPSYFKQSDNKKIIQFLLDELCKCFDTDDNRYKMDELINLSNLLN